MAGEGGPISIAQFQSPAKSILLFEGSGSIADVTNPGETGSGTGNGVTCINWDGHNCRFVSYSTGVFQNITPPSGSNLAPFGALTGWHTDGANYLLADGHAKYLRASSVSAGIDNPTAGDAGTTGSASVAGNGADDHWPDNQHGNFTGSQDPPIIAANTGSNAAQATFSYD